MADTETFNTDLYFGKVAEVYVKPWLDAQASKLGMSCVDLRHQNSSSDFVFCDGGRRITVDVKRTGSEASKFSTFSLEYRGNNGHRTWAYANDRILNLKQTKEGLKCYWIDLNKYRNITSDFEKIPEGHIQNKQEKAREGAYVIYIYLDELDKCGCLTDVTTEVEQAYFVAHCSASPESLISFPAGISASKIEPLVRPKEKKAA